MMPPIVELRRVSRSFDGGRVHALDDVSVALEPGECVAVLGASGSGKSSLIHLLCGLDRPTSGAVYWDGAASGDPAWWSARRGGDIGVVFQDFLLLPALTALQNVAAAYRPDAARGVRLKAAAAALERVGLRDRGGHRPAELSGGERQRVAVARALVNRPRLVLADEPTGSLDSRNADLIDDLLHELHTTYGHALVIITHDQRRAQRCKRILCLHDGKVISDERA